MGNGHGHHSNSDSFESESVKTVNTVKTLGGGGAGGRNGENKRKDPELSKRKQYKSHGKSIKVPRLPPPYNNNVACGWAGPLAQGQ